MTARRVLLHLLRPQRRRSHAIRVRLLHIRTLENIVLKTRKLNCSPSANEIQPSDTETLINTDSFSVQKWSPVANEIKRDDILSVSFTHHMEILLKTKDINEVLFYLRQTVMHQ